MTFEREGDLLNGHLWIPGVIWDSPANRSEWHPGDGSASSGTVTPMPPWPRGDRVCVWGSPGRSTLSASCSGWVAGCDECLSPPLKRHSSPFPQPPAPSLTSRLEIALSLAWPSRPVLLQPGLAVRLCPGGRQPCLACLGHRAPHGGRQM